jgi:hypothetical protein
MDVPYARRLLMMMMMMKENRLLLHCVSLSLVFLERKKRRTAKKNRVVVRRIGNAVWLDKPDVAYNAKECEREMQCEKGRREENVVTITNQHPNDDQR